MIVKRYEARFESTYVYDINVMNVCTQLINYR